MTYTSQYGGYVPVAPIFEKVVLPRIRTRLAEAVGSAAARDSGKTLRHLPDMSNLPEVRRAIRTAAGLGVGVVSAVAAELGVSDRTINAWLRESRPTLRVSVADDIMFRTGLFWWDLTEPGDEHYVTYARVFGNEAVEVAA